jgi:hypothetical protein
MSVSRVDDVSGPRNAEGPRAVITKPDVYRILDGILAARRKAVSDEAA